VSSRKTAGHERKRWSNDFRKKGATFVALTLEERIYSRANERNPESHDHDANIVEETFEKIHADRRLLTSIKTSSLL
jgi:predicted kinase